MDHVLRCHEIVKTDMVRETVEFGVQIVRRIIGQPLLLTFVDSFLGSYRSAGEKGPKEWHCTGCSHG